jgi:hypothetical protein
MNDYLNIELVYNNLIINTYSLPESTFTINNQNDLTELMDGIFGAMINDLLYGIDINVSTQGKWDSANFYILSDNIKINELIKTKDDMNTYNSYGEAILIIYNQIKNIN